MGISEGWYDDGLRAGKFRWWDGEKWTGFYSDIQAVIARGEGPTGSETPPPPPATPRESVPEAPAPAEPASVPSVSPSTRRATAPVDGPRRYRFANSRGWANIEVVGESHHEEQIIRALGRRPRLDEEIEVEMDAALVPEPDNPHDPNAISVRLQGELVGYLERGTAPLYKPSIDRITASGHTATTSARVWAVVRRGWEDTKPRFTSSVRVVLPEPNVLVPANEPPNEQYSVIPWGGGLQVVGEHQHFDVLAPLVTDAGRGLVLVTLHRGVPEKPRAAEFVEVRVDGRRAGQMSGVTSKHFFPIVDHLATRGLITAAWAHLQGSGLAAELVLQATKASEVEPGWLSGEAVTVPRLVPVAASYVVPPAYGAASVPVRPRVKSTLAEKLSRALR